MVESVHWAEMNHDAVVREPRCRVCRVEEVRVFVNQLLDWRGVPVMTSGRHRSRRISYTDVLQGLAEINAALPSWEQITYNSLWVHAKRHYGAAGIATYWGRRLDRAMQDAFRGEAADPA